MFNISSFIRLGLISVLVGLGVYVYLQEQDLKELKNTNLTLQEQLKVCKSENKAKEFEQKWADEFRRTYEINSTDLEATGVENEEIIKSGSNNNTFRDTF